MLRRLKIASLVLLVVWLPATLHCRIEAAGLDLHWLGCHDQEESAVAACADDNCHPLEFQSYKPGKDSTGEVSPASIEDAPGFVLIALPAPLGTRCSSPGLMTGAPPGLAVGWRFAARAVAPARAP